MFLELLIIPLLFSCSSLFQQSRRLGLGLSHATSTELNQRHLFCIPIATEKFHSNSFFQRTICNDSPVNTPLNTAILTSSRKASLVAYHPYPHNIHATSFTFIPHTLFIIRLPWKALKTCWKFNKKTIIWQKILKNCRKPTFIEFKIIYIYII